MKYPTQYDVPKALPAFLLTGFIFQMAYSAEFLEQGLTNTSINQATFHQVSHTTKPQADALINLDVKTLSVNSRCVKLIWLSPKELPHQNFDFFPNTLNAEIDSYECQLLWQESIISPEDVTVFYYKITGDLSSPFRVVFSWLENENQFSSHASWPVATESYNARSLTRTDPADSQYHIIKIGDRP